MVTLVTIVNLRCLNREKYWERTERCWANTEKKLGDTEQILRDTANTEEILRNTKKYWTNSERIIRYSQYLNTLNSDYFEYLLDLYNSEFLKELIASLHSQYN